MVCVVSRRVLFRCICEVSVALQPATPACETIVTLEQGRTLAQVHETSECQLEARLPAFHHDSKSCSVVEHTQTHRAPHWTIQRLQAPRLERKWVPMCRVWQKAWRALAAVRGAGIGEVRWWAAGQEEVCCTMCYLYMNGSRVVRCTSDAKIRGHEGHDNGDVRIVRLLAEQETRREMSHFRDVTCCDKDSAKQGALEEACVCVRI
jgi:hypothetical protein